MTPKVARIDLVPPGDQPIAEVGDRLDVVILAPTTADRGPIRELERKDFTVNTSHDGTAWALLLNPAGIFTSQPARVAFIRAASGGGDGGARLRPVGVGLYRHDVDAVGAGIARLRHRERGLGLRRGARHAGR